MCTTPPRLQTGPARSPGALPAAGEEGDVAGEPFRPDFFVRDWEEEYAPEEVERLHVEAGGVSVREIMTPTPISVSEDDDVTEIARRMIDGHYHRMLVTRDGQLVGIVTSMDLLGVLAEAD